MVSRARKIILTSIARASRASIFSYWNKRNKSNEYSRKLNFLFSEKLMQVAQYPEASIAISEDLRMILVKDYYLIFAVETHTITVLDIWDTRQNPDDFPLK